MQTRNTISKYMTSTPKTIGVEQSIQAASDLMRTLRIRHLPVLKAGRIVGIISDRDIKLVLTFANQDALNLPVSEAMSPSPYLTNIHAQLSEVTETMAANRYGAAIVMDGNKVAGIFTTVDALVALSKIMRAQEQ